MATDEQSASNYGTRIAVAIFAAVAVVGGIIAVGNAARDALRPSERYLIPFHAIECSVPLGRDRKAFLDEVQYTGVFADEINVLENGLEGRLREAFAKHPAVDVVERVTLGPSKRIQVDLRFRSP